jgi:PKD repeat protein
MSYGIEPIFSSACLFEDNIFNQVTAPLMFASCCSGCVAGYNYCTNMYYTVSSGWMINALEAHDAHVCMNLSEGNYLNGCVADWIHGSSSHNVLFRNRITGYEPGKSSDLFCINLFPTNHYWSAVGNILGTTGIQGNYESSAAGSYYSVAIYQLGIHNGGYGDYPDDPVTATTMYRHGNYDIVNKAIVWNSTNSDHSIPNSLYHLSKPTWFGDRRWPAFDPTNGAAIAANTMSATNIPAGYRFIFGIDPPGRPVNQSPLAVASATTPTSGTAPLRVSFSSAGSYDPEGAALSYIWNFGNGGTSTLANPTNVYNTSGQFNAYLTVSDGTNSAVSGNLTINVLAAGSNYPPVAVATPSATAGRSPLTVNFSSAGSYDPEGAHLTYSWTFGDGSTSTSTNPAYTYSTSGSYAAKLTVSDGTNSASSALVTITVANGASGLVAAYGMEEGSGSTVVDASGNNNNAAINAATWVTGKFGNALSFNGSSSILTISDSPSLDLSAGMTLEAWVYPTPSSGGWSDIVFKNTDMYFLMGSTPQGTPGFGGSFASSNVYGTALPLNTWTHLAGTCDGTTMRFYVNGVQVSSLTQTGAISTSTGTLSIGGDPTYGQYWTGLIDEIRIYSRALSGSEIQSDMATPVVGTAVVIPPPQGLHILSP